MKNIKKLKRKSKVIYTQIIQFYTEDLFEYFLQDK